MRGRSPQPTRDLGERLELPQWGSGWRPGQKRILVLPKCLRMPLVEMFVKTDILSKDVCQWKKTIAFDH